MSDSSSAVPSDALTDVPVDVTLAYRFLVQHPGASLADFAASLSVGTDVARAVLDQLSTVALVEEQESALVAVSPLRAMQKLITQEQAHLVERQRMLLESFEALTLVLPSYRGQRTPSSLNTYVEELQDLGAIRQRLEELAMGAKSEVLSLTPPASDPSAARSASRSLDLGVLGRGVSMRTIYPEILYDDLPTQRYAAELAAAGGAVRFASDLPLRMVIVDRRQAVLPNDPDDGGHAALLIWHPGVVAALVAMFDAYWRASREIGHDECSSLERLILSHLLVGAKDATIARHLGLSVRTVRRCIALMMARLGASSRFELGVSAAQRQWV